MTKRIALLGTGLMGAPMTANFGRLLTAMAAPERSVYPTPLNTEGDDRAFVGRVRIDQSHERGLIFWCVSDNLRKGAATNALQIAEELIRRGTL